MCSWRVPEATRTQFSTVLRMCRCSGRSEHVWLLLLGSARPGVPARSSKRCGCSAQNTPGRTCIFLLTVQGATVWQLWAVEELDGPMFLPRIVIFLLLLSVRTLWENDRLFLRLYGSKCSTSLHALITQAINMPSGKGLPVFIIFLHQKKLIPWLCAISSFIFHLTVARLLCQAVSYSWAEEHRRGRGLQSVQPLNREAEKKMQSIKFLFLTQYNHSVCHEQMQIRGAHWPSAWMQNAEISELCFLSKLGLDLWAGLTHMGKADMGRATTQRQSLPRLLHQSKAAQEAPATSHGPTSNSRI